MRLPHAPCPRPLTFASGHCAPPLHPWQASSLFPGAHTGNVRLSLAGLHPDGAWGQLPPRGPCDAKQGWRLSPPRVPLSLPHPLHLSGHRAQREMWARALPTSLGQNKEWTSAAVSCPALGLGAQLEGTWQGVPTELPCTERREEEREKWKHRARPTGLASCCVILLGVYLFFRLAPSEAIPSLLPKEGGFKPAGTKVRSSEKLEKPTNGP